MRSGITRCDGDHDGFARRSQIDTRVMRITSRNPLRRWPRLFHPRLLHIRTACGTIALM
jgi:hypothetical protein